MPDRAPTQNQQVLAASKRDLLRRFPSFGQQLLDLLERDGSTVCYARVWSEHLAALRVAPSPAISKQFDISLEIPLLIADFEGKARLEPRILRHLDTSHELRKSASADKDIAILVATDERAHQFVRDRKRFAFPILVLDAEPLADDGYRQTDLRAELARTLRSMNHFDFSNEIRQAADFFGRLSEIDALTQLAMSGQAVGIFGLRRAGKTSLLYRVRESLEEKGVATIFAQLNATPDADSFRETVARDLARLLLDAEVKIPASSYVMPDGAIRADAIPARRWIFEMDAMLDALQRHVVLFIDEIDLANEDAAEFDESELEERRRLSRAVQVLRGLIQLRNERSEHRLSFIAAGVAASIFTEATRFGRDNPLFGFASARFLAPMSRDEMRDMVRTLGKRSGLKFDEFSLFDRLLSEYGGHPHLTRQACARVADLRDERPNPDVPYRVSTADLDAVSQLTGEGSPSFAAQGTLKSFSRWYPDEGAAVYQLLFGDVVGDAAVHHAIQFGLCDPGPVIRIAALRRQFA